MRIEFSTDRTANTVTATMSVADGWHLNAHEPLQDFYIPVNFDIAGTALGANAYPTALVKTLGYSDEPLALYEGDLALTGPLRTGTAILTLQACSDEICLAPEELRFQIW